MWDHQKSRYTQFDLSNSSSWIKTLTKDLVETMNIIFYILYCWWCRIGICMPFLDSFKVTTGGIIKTFKKKIDLSSVYQISWILDFSFLHLQLVVKSKFSRNLKNSCDNVASIRVLVLFEQYGQQKNAPTKVIPTFFPCIFHVQTQCLQM